MNYSFEGIPFFNRCILSGKKLFILLVSSTVIKWHLRFLKVNIHLVWIWWFSSSLVSFLTFKQSEHLNSQAIPELHINKLPAYE